MNFRKNIDHYQFESSLLVDYYYPLGLAVIFGLLAYFSNFTIHPPQQVFLSSVSLFGAFTVGYVGVSLCILTGASTDIKQYLFRDDRLVVRTLRLYFGWGLYSGVMLSIVSLVGLLFNAAIVGFSSILIALLVLYLACLYRLFKSMLCIFGAPELTSRESEGYPQN